MENSINNVKDFEGMIKDQRQRKVTTDEIIKTIKQLPSEHLVEYLEFLEHNCPEKMIPGVGEVVLLKLGAKNDDYIAKFSAEISSKEIQKLEIIVNAKSDRLLDTYIHTIMPDEMVNEFILLKAERLNQKYHGKYHNAQALIKLAVEICRVEDADKLFPTFLKMENKYYEENEPNVDVNTFYKLVVPMLRRFSIKKGPAEFYELRDKTVQELRKHGVNPGHLSIDILDRRGKHRSRPSTPADMYHGFDLF